MGSHNGSNGTPLDTPLFWLDNTFKYPLKLHKYKKLSLVVS